MARFKDIATGNVFEFTHPHDIELMRKHTEYVEVVEENQEVVVKPSVKQKKSKEV